MKINGKYIGSSNPIETKNDDNKLWSRQITNDMLVKREKLQKSAKAAYENISFDRLA